LQLFHLSIRFSAKIEQHQKFSKFMENHSFLFSYCNSHFNEYSLINANNWFVNYQLEITTLEITLKSAKPQVGTGDKLSLCSKYSRIFIKRWQNLAQMVNKNTHVRLQSTVSKFTCTASSQGCDPKRPAFFRCAVKQQNIPERIKVRVRVRLLKDDGGERRL